MNGELVIRTKPSEAVKQGKDRPRPLTHDETALAARNRRAADIDLFSMVAWESRGFISGRFDSPQSDPGAVRLPADFGNFIDWMLSPARPDNDPRPWQTVEHVFKRMDRDEHAAWTRGAVESEALIRDAGSAGCTRHRLEQAPGTRGSGIIGLKDEFYLARSAMSRAQDMPLHT